MCLMCRNIRTFGWSPLRKCMRRSGTPERTSLLDHPRSTSRERMDSLKLIHNSSADQHNSSDSIGMCKCEPKHRFDSMFRLGMCQHKYEYQGLPIWCLGNLNIGIEYWPHMYLMPNRRTMKGSSSTFAHTYFDSYL